MSQVAIKCIFKKKLSKRTCDNLIDEIGILKNISSDFIVSLIDFVYDVWYIYLIFEYCSLGDMATYLRNQSNQRQALQRFPGIASPKIKHLPESTVRNFLQQLSTAIKVCHSRSVSHFDLKPQNILISKKNIFHEEGEHFVILKLADFGFAKHLKKEDTDEDGTSDQQANTNESSLSDFRGTPLYMAPEIIFKQDYDGRADLWSLGVVLFEILVGKTPFHSTSVDQLVQRMRTEKVRIPSSVKLSPECHDLLVRLLQSDPNKRISFQDLFDHPFLDLEHMPSLDSYQKGCSILSEAVKEDKNNNVSNAIDLYLAGLDYLLPVYNFGLPFNEETVKLNLSRKPLKTKIQSYLDRIEILKSKRDKKNFLNSREEALFSSAYEECIHADFLFESESWKECLEVYEKNIQILLTLLKKMPEGQQRDCFIKQVSYWLSRGEESKCNLKKRQQFKEETTKPNKNNQEGWVTLHPRQIKNYKRPRNSRHTRNSVSESIGCRVQ